MIVAAFLSSMVGALVGRVVAEAWIERRALRGPAVPAPSSLPVACPTTTCLLCLAPVALVDPLTLSTCPQPNTEVTYADRPVGVAPV